MTPKQRKQHIGTFKLIENNKLNLNWPRSYNFHLGYVDREYMDPHKRVFLPDIRQL